MIQIRKANTWDTIGIANIKRLTWPDDDTSEISIAAALSTEEHHTMIALDNDNAVGYMSCFITTSQSGKKRWELDQLAVSPAYRQQGIGKDLVEHALNAASHNDIDLMRALIQVDNLASQKSFATHGLQTDTQPYQLYICTEPSDGVMPIPESLHLIPIKTFSYQGFWLEGHVNNAALQAATGLVRREEIELVGVLIPETEQALCRAAEKHGYQRINTYHWWVK